MVGDQFFGEPLCWETKFVGNLKIRLYGFLQIGRGLLVFKQKKPLWVIGLLCSGVIKVRKWGCPLFTRSLGG